MCSKFKPMVQVIDHKTKWVTDGITVYQFDDDDVFEKQFDMTRIVRTDKERQALFGDICPSDTVEETGIVFDMRLDDYKVKAALMLHQRGDIRSLFFVDDSLLGKVRPRKASDSYRVGLRDTKRVLYNQDMTIGVVCIAEEEVPKVMNRYKDVFIALDTMRIFGGTSEGK